MFPEAIPSTARVELAVRADPPEPTVDRLARLEGRLDQALPRNWELTTTRWPGKVDPTAERGVDAVIARRLSTFEAWADDRGVDLAPAFDARTCYSVRSGERYEARVLPVASVSIEGPDGLLAVFPHVDDAVVTVGDAVEWLASAPGRRATARRR